MAMENITVINMVDDIWPLAATLTPFIQNTTEPKLLDGLVSEAVRDVFILMNYILLMGLICFFGIIFNTINIIIFLKQGLNDVVNIALLGLTIADLCCVAAHCWQSICYNLWMFGSFEDINFQHVQYITASWPSGMFGRISSWLTVFISLERCMCVLLPLHVKIIMTPRRVIFIIISIYVVMIGLNIPVFYAVGLKYYYFPHYNRTMLGFFYRQNGVKIEQICLFLLGISQTISFALVVILTLLLSAKLRKETRWRQSVSVVHRLHTKNKTDDNANKINLSSKEKRVSKMIVTVCLLFVFLLAPYWFTGISMAVFPEYNNLGRYRNIFVSVFSVALTLEALCSSINILIYYRMSAKYRKTLRELIGVEKIQKNTHISSVIDSGVKGNKM